jgi:hypothetical protein
MCSSGLLLDLDLAFGSFLRGKKMHPKQRGRRIIKKYSPRTGAAIYQSLSISLGTPLDSHDPMHPHFDTQRGDR